MSNAIRGIDIVTYLVRDAGHAISFYRDTLGLPMTREYDGQGAEFELPDGSAFGLWKPEEGDGGFRPSGGVMFAVDDCRAAVAELQAKGVPFVAMGQDYVEETPVCFMAFASDPDGNTFVIHQRK